MVDGTGSMRGILEHLKAVVKIAMTETLARLKEEFTEGIKGFELQLLVYRNYDFGDLAIEPSEFVEDSSELDGFLKSIKPKTRDWLLKAFGFVPAKRPKNIKSHNEAIEVALAHANKQHEEWPISQIIIVGDATSNTPTETDALRAHNEANKVKFTDAAVYFPEQRDRLIANGVTIHTVFTPTKKLTHCKAEDFHAMASEDGSNVSYQARKKGETISETDIEQLGKDLARIISDHIENSAVTGAGVGNQDKIKYLESNPNTGLAQDM